MDKTLASVHWITRFGRRVLGQIHPESRINFDLQSGMCEEKKGPNLKNSTGNYLRAGLQTKGEHVRDLDEVMDYLEPYSLLQTKFVGMVRISSRVIKDIQHTRHVERCPCSTSKRGTVRCSGTHHYHHVTGACMA
jgi:hypothetical protein